MSETKKEDSTNGPVAFIEVSIPFTETITKDGAFSQADTLYHIKVETSSMKWKITRTFSEFKDLHSKLKKEEPKVAKMLLKLPPQTFFNNNEAQFVMQRQTQLQEYLQTVCRDSILKNTKCFKEWISYNPVYTINEKVFKKTQIAKYEKQQQQKLRKLEVLRASVDQAALDGNEEKRKELTASALKKYLQKVISLDKEDLTEVLPPDSPSPQEDSPLTRAKKESDAAAQEIKRKNVAQEIVSTEKSFLEKLIYIIQKYKVPLEEAAKNKDTEIISREEINVLFANIDEIKNVSKQIFSGLNASSTSTDVLAKVFVDTAPVMKAYISYISTFENCINTYAAVKLNEKFRQFEAECEKDSRSGFLTLSDYLVMPVQRVPRLKLLLDELLKVTPKDHPDYTITLRACNEIDKLCTKINQTTKDLLTVGNPTSLPASTLQHKKSTLDLRKETNKSPKKEEKEKEKENKLLKRGKTKKNLIEIDKADVKPTSEHSDNPNKSEDDTVMIYRSKGKKSLIKMSQYRNTLASLADVRPRSRTEIDPPSPTPPPTSAFRTISFRNYSFHF